MKTEEKTSILENLIHLTTISENLYMQRELERIQKIVLEISDDFELGKILRQIL